MGLGWGALLGLLLPIPLAPRRPVGLGPTRYSHDIAPSPTPPPADQPSAHSQPWLHRPQGPDLEHRARGLCRGGLTQTPSESIWWQVCAEWGEWQSGSHTGHSVGTADGCPSVRNRPRAAERVWLGGQGGHTRTPMSGTGLHSLPGQQATLEGALPTAPLALPNAARSPSPRESCQERHAAQTRGPGPACPCHVGAC